MTKHIHKVDKEDEEIIEFLRAKEFIQENPTQFYATHYGYAIVPEELLLKWIASEYADDYLVKDVDENLSYGDLSHGF